MTALKILVSLLFFWAIVIQAKSGYGYSKKDGYGYGYDTYKPYGSTSSEESNGSHSSSSSSSEEGCTTCKLSQISLTTDPESGIAPTTTYPNDEISGCTDTTVTCNFGNGATGSMKFNKGAVNADTTPVAISTHTLFCQDNGIFGFTQNGITTTVTEITCSELKKCATCKLSQLSLTTDPESGVSPAPTNPIPGSNGCTEMTVTCNFGEAFTGSMKFNQGAVNADAAPVGVSTHTLICQKDGTFGFTQNGVTTTVTEVACKKTATIKCDSSYITQETTFTAPQYINVQPNGDITARCEDPLAITIGQYITDEPDTSGTTLIDTPLYCNPTTGKYSIVPNFPTPVTRVQCCSFRCPLLTYTGGSMTYDLSNDGCPVGVIRCNANTGPVTLSINGKPVNLGANVVLNYVYCDNTAMTWKYNGAPITSVTCSAPAKAVDCDERGGPFGICIAKPQITLTPGPTASPNFINPFGASCNQVFCGFGQPNPFGRMTINNGAITIDPNPTQRVFAQINCNADRTWNYVDPNGNLIPITEVSCVPV